MADSVDVEPPITTTSDGLMGPPPLPPPPSAAQSASLGDWELVPHGDLQLVVTPSSHRQQRAVVYNRTHKRFAILPRNQVFCPLCKRGLETGYTNSSPQAHSPDHPSDHANAHSSRPHSSSEAAYEDDSQFEELPATPTLTPRNSAQGHERFQRDAVRQPRIQARPQHRLLAAAQEVDPVAPNQSGYFKLLSESVQPSPASSQPSTPRPSLGQLDWASHLGISDAPNQQRDQQLDPRSFVQGYYERFFIEECRLGRGARGVVFLCEHVLEQTRLGRYAVKKISVGDSTQSLMTTLREVKHLEQLRHPSIASYHHSWIEKISTTAFQPSVPHLFLLMSYCNGGSLHSWINQRKSLVERDSNSFFSDPSTFRAGDTMPQSQNEKRKRAFKERRNGKFTSPSEMNAVHHLRLDEILALFTDITAGLEFLHSHMIMHLDLKAENVLLEYEDDEGFGTPRAVLSDFGSSEARNRLQERERTGCTGTLDYVAPEALQINPATGKLRDLDASADLWSLGLLLHLLCFLQLPYTHEDIDELKQEILDYPGFRISKQTRKDLPPALLQTLAALLNRNPNARPSASDVLAGLSGIDMKPFDETNSALVLPSQKPPSQAKHPQHTPDEGFVSTPKGIRALNVELRALTAGAALSKMLASQRFSTASNLIVAAACFLEVVFMDWRSSALSLLVFILALADAQAFYDYRILFASFFCSGCAIYQDYKYSYTKRCFPEHPRTS